MMGTQEGMNIFLTWESSKVLRTEEKKNQFIYHTYTQDLIATLKSTTKSTATLHNFTKTDKISHTASLLSISDILFLYRIS